MDFNKLISECTAYDFKAEVEHRKSKSWLKSVSAFANGIGGDVAPNVAKTATEDRISMMTKVQANKVIG